MISVEHARAVVATVVDPEVPVLTLCDLGIVRDVQARNGGIEVVLTPTYSGCPATEVITSDVKKALADAGFAKVTVTHQRAQHGPPTGSVPRANASCANTALRPPVARRLCWARRSPSTSA